MWVEMAFCDEAIAPEVFEVMLRRLCNTIQRSARDVHAPLKLPLMAPDPPHRPLPLISQKPRAAPSRPKPQAFSFSLLNPEDIVSRVWKFLQNSVLRPAHTARVELTLDTPYFDVRGDLVYTLQLAKVYRKEGIEIAMEDLIDHPLIRQQINLLNLSAMGKEDVAEQPKPIILMAHPRACPTAFERVIETPTLYF